MIIPAKDATHVRCNECLNESPLGHFATSYEDVGDCLSCGGDFGELLLLSEKPLRSEKEDGDYLRDRRKFGGKLKYVYDVTGNELE